MANQYLGVLIPLALFFASVFIICASDGKSRLALSSVIIVFILVVAMFLTEKKVREEMMYKVEKKYQISITKAELGSTSGTLHYKRGEKFCRADFRKPDSGTDIELQNERCDDPPTIVPVPANGSVVIGVEVPS